MYHRSNGYAKNILYKAKLKDNTPQSLGGKKNDGRVCLPSFAFSMI